MGTKLLGIFYVGYLHYYIICIIHDLFSCVLYKIKKRLDFGHACFSVCRLLHQNLLIALINELYKIAVQRQ